MALSRPTRTGTAWFSSRIAANRYYRGQGLKARDVAAKIEAGEIHIGTPPILPGHILEQDTREGRWFYVERPFAIPTRGR